LISLLDQARDPGPGCGEVEPTLGEQHRRLVRGMCENSEQQMLST